MIFQEVHRIEDPFHMPSPARTTSEPRNDIHEVDEEVASLNQNEPQSSSAPSSVLTYNIMVLISIYLQIK